MKDYAHIDRLESLRNDLLSRRSQVVDEIWLWGMVEKNTSCNRPNTPLCVLETELKDIDRYICTLDKSIFYIKER